jgi:hypothetical protein
VWVRILPERIERLRKVLTKNLRPRESPGVGGFVHPATGAREMRGKPRKAVTIPMNAEEYALLTEIAQKAGLTRSGVVRRAVLLAKDRTADLRMIPPEGKIEMWGFGKE